MPAWPAQHDRDRPGLPSARGPARCSTPWPPPATRTSNAACRRSGPTATSSSSRSPGCPRGPTPPRASSARWRWRCSWPPTSWPPSDWVRRRCSCSTTCSPSWTRGGPGRSSRGSRPGQTLLTTAQPAPPEVAAAKVYAMADGRPRGGPGGRRVSPEPSPPAGLRAPAARRVPRGAVQAARAWRARPGVGRLFAGWSEIVGEAMAEHVRPVRIDAIGPGGDRRPPGLGHPGPPSRGHPARPGGGLRGGRSARQRLEVRVRALSRALAGRSHRPGDDTPGGYTGSLESGEDPRARTVHCARPGIRRDTGSHPLGHCERARLWR